MIYFRMASLANTKDSRPRSQETSSSFRSASNMLQDVNKLRKLSGLSFLDCKIKGVHKIIPKVLNLNFNDNFNGKMGSSSNSIDVFNLRNNTEPY